MAESVPQKEDFNMNFLTIDDVQNLLKLSSKQTRALMKTEGFPSIKIGSEYRVEEQAFRDWIGTTKSIKLDYTGC